MRIGVDIRSLLAGTGRGVSHYTASLLAELVRTHPDDEWCLVQTGRQSYRLPASLEANNVTLRHLRVPNKLLNLTLGSAGLPRLDRVAGKPDVFFAPNLGFVATGTTPLVVTVHDLSYKLYPRFFSARERAWHAAIRPRHLLQRAKAIVTVSEQTKRELAEHYETPTEKVSAIPSGIDDAYRTPVSSSERLRVREQYRLPAAYILYVGAFEPRKNIPTLVEGFRKAKRAGLAANLVLAGPGSEQWRGSAADSNILSLGYVAEADKPALYAEAQTCVLVSWHEGFGFTPLEALATGTPSVVSDLPVFQETLGDAALRVAPDNSHGLAENLVHLEHDDKLGQGLLDAGQPVIDRLTWANTASATYRVLSEAANPHA